VWAYRLTEPLLLERIEIDEPEGPAAGEVVVDFGVGGICGSDLPKYVTGRSHSDRDCGGPGWPLHELTGTVVASGDDHFRAGDPVIGAVPEALGLRQRCRLPVDRVVRRPAAVSSEHAVMIQPLATVLYAVDRLGDVSGRTAAVLGLGSIGLLFAAVLADRGATVVGVDPVDRSNRAEPYGVSTLITERAENWAARLGPADRVDICIEAVGHQTTTLPAALDAVAPHGTVYAFGVPDDESYPLPFRSFFDKYASLLTGVTRDWTGALTASALQLVEHPEWADGYITHRFGIDEAQTAYRTALRQEPGRVKVVIEA